MLTRTNAPGVDHVAHKDPTIADLTRVGNFQDDIHRRLYELVASDNRQCHTLYHIR